MCDDAADRLDVGRADERADQRLGDLRLEQLRAARPLHVDDDLRIGDVGNGVERRGADRVDAEQHGRRRPAARRRPSSG